jgi:hypothetical protein
VSSIRIFSLPLVPFLFLVTLSGCNFLSWMDSPSGDEQILSRARACFDKGDFECAYENYTTLETTSLADIAISEKAFAELDQEGAGMGPFMTSFYNGSGGPGITKLANRILSYGAGPSIARRVTMYQAYRRHLSITDPQIKGLVHFVASVSLMAEIMAEEAQALGSVVNRALIANNPAACLSSVTACVGGDAACSKTGGMGGTGGAIAVNGGSSPPEISAGRTLDLINAFMAEVQNAMGPTELNVTGGPFAGLSSFSATFGSVQIITPAGGGCFRFNMLDKDIGSE